MFSKILFITLLVLAKQSDSGDYFLSPPLPSTAFVGQYYTIQFRVIGVDNPLFKFDGLPKCFKGSPDGVLEGNPNKAGSYPIKVTYSVGR